MYETPDQKEPEYEAKGIETVRRDGCPIVAKVRIIVLLQGYIARLTHMITISG